MTTDTQQMWAAVHAIEAHDLAGLVRRLSVHVGHNIPVGTNDGFPTSVAWSPTPRGGDSEHTSVEAAVFAAERRDPVGEALAEALYHLRRADAALNQAERLADRLDDMADPRADERRPTCCELHCDDPSAPGHAGRCRPCYEWRQRRLRAGSDDPGPVPKETIDGRRKNRRRALVDAG